MQAFRTLEHTADVGFEAFGSTQEVLFANAARALTDLVVDLDTIEARDELAIEVEGRGTLNLLVNWLSEMLYRFDTEGWLGVRFEVRRMDENFVSAVAHGEKLDRARHAIKLLVKAITYHQLSVDQIEGSWRARVYVDI